MLNKQYHANGAEAWIDATTKTDEPYNLAAGIGTITATLASGGAIITYVTTKQMVPVYVLVGLAAALLVMSAVLSLVGNYKRNTEITARMERYRKEEMDLANKQQQTQTKQQETDEPKKENGQEINNKNNNENNKENGQENNNKNNNENGQENNNENNIPPVMSSFSPEENQEFPKRFDIKPPVAQQNMGNEGPNNSNSKNKPMKLDLATLFAGLGASKKKGVVNNVNTGLPPETQGQNID